MRSMTDEGESSKARRLGTASSQAVALRATTPHPTSLREVTFSRKGRRAAPVQPG